ALNVSTRGKTIFSGAVDIGSLATGPLPTDPSDSGKFINGGSVTTSGSVINGADGSQSYSEKLIVGKDTTLRAVKPADGNLPNSARLEYTTIDGTAHNLTLSFEGGLNLFPGRVNNVSDFTAGPAGSIR